MLLANDLHLQHQAKISNVFP